jgi:hypothetical protein
MLTSTIFRFFIFDHTIGPNYLILIAAVSFHPLSAAVYSLKVILITIFKLPLMYRPFHNYTFFSSRFLLWDLQKIFLGLHAYITSSFLMRNPLLCDRWLRRKWLMTMTKNTHTSTYIRRLRQTDSKCHHLTPMSVAEVCRYWVRWMCNIKNQRTEACAAFERVKNNPENHVWEKKIMFCNWRIWTAKVQIFSMTP